MMFSSRKEYLFCLLGILILTAIAFSPALQGKFLLWDDNVHLTENVAVRSLDGEHVQDMFTQRVNTIYIPLTTFSFALEYRFFEYKPFMYYLDNLLLHLGVVVLVFMFLRKLGFSGLISLTATAIFALHPSRVESVAWITERKDVLYALLYLLSLLMYIKYVLSARIKSNVFYFVAACMFGVLSILAKPMAVSLPLIFLLLDWHMGRGINKKTILEKVPVFIILVGICVWGTYSQHVRLPIAENANPVLVWLWTFAFYIRQFILPITNAPNYQLPEPVSLVNSEYTVALCVFAAAALSCFVWRKNRPFIFAFLFYVLSIFFLWRTDAGDTNIVADRFMYLPGLGFCLMVGFALDWFMTNRKNKTFLKVGIGILVVSIFSFYMTSTFRMAKLWTDPVALWKYQIEKFPNGHIGYTNLADALGKTDEYQKAQEEYKKALSVAREGYEIDQTRLADSFNKVQYLVSLYKKSIELGPNFVEGIYNSGKFYNDLGMPKEALEYYKKAIDINSRFKDAYFSWAELLGELGETELSIKAYKENIHIFADNPDVYINVFLAFNDAVKKYPGKKNIYIQAREETVEAFIKLINNGKPKANHFFNLGYLYQEMGDVKRAVSAYEEALEIQPFHENTLYNLGNVYRDSGRVEEALAMYQKVIKANPHKTDAYLNIGSIYSRLGKMDEAREYFQDAARAGGGSAKAWFNLAFLEESDGKLEEAKKLYLKSISLDPQNAEACYNLGNLYAKLNDQVKALEQFKKTVEINSSHLNGWINLSIMYYRLEDYREAVKALDEAILLGYDAPKEYLQALTGYR